MIHEAVIPSLIYFTVDLLIKTTLLLLAVTFLDRLAQKRSAAFRHRIWAFAFIAIAGLPIASCFLPGLQLAIVPANWIEPPSQARSQPVSPVASIAIPRNRLDSHPASPTLDAQQSVDLNRAEREILQEKPLIASLPANDTAPLPVQHSVVPEGAHSGTSGWISWILVAWMIGACIALTPLAYGIGRTIHLQSTSLLIEEQGVFCKFTEWCRKLGVYRRVRFLESKGSVVPMTWGVIHPVVMVPNDWRRWNADRTRLVVLHELAHVARLDVVYQLLGRVVCSLFWFHPMTWYALKRLRVERELACDDCVVMAGELPSDYAGQLVSIAREYQSMVLPPAVAMAQPSGLEIRIRSLLDQARSHSPLTKGVAFAMILSAWIVVLMLAPIRLQSSTMTLGAESVNQVSSLSVSPTDETKMLTLKGTVVGPDGQPVQQARISVVRTFQSNTSWSYQHEIVAQGNTDPLGAFHFEVPAKSKRFANHHHLEEQSIRIHAAKEGFGADETKIDSSITSHSLQLVSTKLAIEGRVVDLEGKPMSGVHVQVLTIDKPAVPLETWVAQAKNNPTTMAGNSMLSLSANGLAKPPQVAFFPSKESILTSRFLGAPEVITGADGTFTLPGIGDGRQATLQLQSPNIATAWVRCVTFDMDPVNMPVTDPRYRVGKTFGRRFDFSCEPTQWIRGVVRDRKTGTPLPGVNVSLGQFADNLLSIEGFLDVTTDANGRYELKGIPQAPNGSRGVKLDFRPSPDQPYFRCDLTVPKSSTLEPIDFNVELTRGVWIEGRVRDAKSKKGVRGMVAYYPNRNNPEAKKHEAWDEGLRSMGYDELAPTDDEGRFRIPSMTGSGVVRVVLEEDSEYEMVPSLEAERAMQSLNEKYYHISMPGNAMVEVDIERGETSKAIDIEVKPLPSRSLHVVDIDGKDVTLYSMAGRLPKNRPTLSGRGASYWDQNRVDSAVVKVLPGSELEQKRPLIFFHPTRNLGAMLPVRSLGQETDQPYRVTLQPCVTLTGKLVDKEGKPINQGMLFAGAGVIELHGMFPLANGGHSMTTTMYPEFGVLTRASLKSDGSFEYVVPPGIDYSLCLIGEHNIVLFQDRELSPGQKVDLGTIDISDDPKNWPKPKVTKRESSIRSETLVNATAPGVEVSPSGHASPLFQGKVLLPNGKPAEGVSLYFVYHQNGKLPDSTVRPAATTDAAGQFEIRGLPVDNAGTPLEYMSIVARKPGYGLVHRPALLLESNGVAISPQIAEGLKRVRERFGAERELRLVEDMPLVGRVLSTEGKPISNVRVSVASLSFCESNLDAWEVAATDPKADYYSLNAHLQDVMNGFQMPSIIPDALTDHEGHFTLQGIGRDRIVDLIVSGPNIETMTFHARTRQGKTVRVPHQFGMKREEIPDEVFYPSSFELVVLPSVPIEGRVVDAVSGLPLPGITITAGREVTFSRSGKPHIVTSTDKDGRYRLDGLSGSSDEQLFVVPPRGSRYLPGGIGLTISRTGKSIVQNFELNPGVLLRGHVTDTTTGLPIRGALQYSAFAKNPHLKDHAAFPFSNHHEVRTDDQGNYEIAVLHGEGVITFRPDDHAMYRRSESPKSKMGDRFTSPRAMGMFETVPTWVNASDYHYVKQLSIEAGATVSELSFELASGESLKVKVVRSNGETANKALLKGTVERGGWYQTDSGLTRIEGYYADHGRDLFAFDPETSQAALVKLTGSPKKEITVQLRPSGVIRGRIVDKQGVALEGVQLICESIPSDNSGNTSLRHTTDKDGKFELRGVVPDYPHSVWAMIDGEGMSPLIQDAVVDPNQGLNLGNVSFDPK